MTLTQLIAYPCTFGGLHFVGKNVVVCFMGFWLIKDISYIRSLKRVAQHYRANNQDQLRSMEPCKYPCKCPVFAPAWDCGAISRVNEKREKVNVVFAAEMLIRTQNERTLRKTNIAMEDPPFEDVIISYWTWGFSDIMSVFRGVIICSVKLT